MWSLADIGWTVQLAPPSGGGAPSALNGYANLAPRCERWRHSIVATGGFESADTTFVTDLDEAVTWLNRLMWACWVYDAELWTVWEGFLSQVSVTIGGERRSVSVDALANRINVRYTNALGEPASTGASSNTTSIGLYGTKDRVLSLSNTTLSAAQNIRAAALAAMAYPRAVPASEIGTSEAQEVRVDLAFSGWYPTLDWVATNRADTSTEATTTQVGALISGSSPGIGATNAFIDTSTAAIAASGVSDTRKIEADTPYRQKIETLLGQGNSSGERLAWGVYEGRQFRANAWAGATPSTVAYRRRLGDPAIYSQAGLPVPPHLVRPDALYETIDLLDYASGGGADIAARYYVERVSLELDGSGYRVSLEPAASDALDARLARLGGR